MATAEVQHAIPAAVVVSNCFEEEESHKVAVARDITSAVEVEEPALRTQAANDNGIIVDSKKEDDGKRKDDATAGDGSGHRVVETVAREVEAKLGIAQQDEKVAAEEERRGGRGAMKKARAVVVRPVDDDDEELDREAGQLAEAAPPACDASGHEEPKGEGEAPQDEKAHE
ncbi:unnamed protein product [Urochloa humidicola]